MIELLVIGVIGVISYVVYEHRQATATPQPPKLPAAGTSPPVVATGIIKDAQGRTLDPATGLPVTAQSASAPLLVLPTGQGTGVLDPMTAAAAASAAAQAQAAQAAAKAAGAAGASPAEQQAAAVAAAAKAAESLKNQAADAALAMGNSPEATAAALALTALPVFGGDDDFGQNHALSRNMTGKPRGFGSSHAAAQAAAAHAQNLARRAGR